MPDSRKLVISFSTNEPARLPSWFLRMDSSTYSSESNQLWASSVVFERDLPSRNRANFVLRCDFHFLEPNGIHAAARSTGKITRWRP